MPSKDDMLADTKEQMQHQWDKGFSVRNAHSFDDNQVMMECPPSVFDFSLSMILFFTWQAGYFQQLADAGQMPNLPEVLIKIYEDVSAQRKQFPNSYRQFNYRIIDENTFERTAINWSP